MKTTLIAILIMLSGTLTANAQMDKQKKNKSMEKKEMMMQQKDKKMPGMQGIMMNRQKMMMQEMPMRRYMMMVNMLPKMQDKLSLSPEQTKELIDMKAAFEKKLVDMKSAMAEKQMQLKELLKNKASASEVETQLQKCAESRVKMHVAAYETAMKMHGVLNEEQIKNCKMMDDDSDEMMQGDMME